MGIDAAYGIGSLKQGVCTSSTRPASPFEGQMIYETDTDRMLVYNGSAWATLTPQSATVLTFESTVSTSFTDLTTSGPAVTLATGTTALVTINTYSDNDTGTIGNQQTYMGVAVSGATTLAASDDYSASHRLGPNLASISSTFKLTGLTAGSNTFTAKYRVTGATGRFQKRSITVVGIP
jgi:hypothetical protein